MIIKLQKEETKI